MADNGSIVDLQHAVVEARSQARHAVQGVTDRGGQWAFARYGVELAVQPSLRAVECGSGLSLPDLGALVRGQSSCGFLDGVKLSDPADGLVGDGRALRLVHVDELAPDMGEAGDLAYLTRAIQVFEPGIAVRCPLMVCLQTMRGGMHPAGMPGQMILGMLAFAIGRELISSHCPPLVRGQWRGWRAGWRCPRDFNLRRSSRP